VPVSRKLQTGGRDALGSEEPHRWEEKKPFKDEPSSQDGLSTRYEQGEDGSETAKKVTQEEIPALSKELEAVRRERRVSRQHAPNEGGARELACAHG
jgi:50S ribosomal subunit-associated GTPase HflX